MKKPITTLRELAQNLRGDCYYFLEPYSAGDTYYLCALKPALEQKHGGKIIFVVKPSHEAVVELFGYECVVVRDEDFNIFYTEPSRIWECENTAVSAQLGKIYVAHPSLLEMLAQHTLVYQTQIEWNLWFLDLPSDTKLTLPTNLPKISENLKARLDKIAPLDKIVLFCPEANSCPSLPVIIFKDECKRLREQGFFVVVNLAKEKDKYHRHFIDGVCDLNLSFMDTIALALGCAKVISTRSGFCDIITPYQKNLKIYYTDLWWMWHWRLNGENSPKEIYIKETPIYKAFLRFLRNQNHILPLKLYKRYIAKGFLRRVRTPFTAYFKIYKNYKRAMVKNGVDSGALGVSGSGLDNSRLDCSVLDNSEFDKEMLDYLAQTYEYQLGLLLERACKGFWRGGFVGFIFDYLKLRKRKKTLTRLNEILR